jgi:hypothetical protein
VYARLFGEPRGVSSEQGMVDYHQVGGPLLRQGVAGRAKSLQVPDFHRQQREPNASASKVREGRT